MKICEVVAHALQEEGISTVFGLMGDGNLRLLTYWATELEQRYYGARHESAAVAMADGYARVSGEVGVCTVTQGPGVTNTLTALVSARKARTPLVLMVGDVAAFQKGWPQDIDHDSVFRAADVPLIKLDNPATAFSDIVKAVRLARSRRGPVGVNLPVDVQETDWDAWQDQTSVEKIVSPSPIIELEVIRRVVDLLSSARRPVIIGGRGAVEADCAAQLLSIGDRIGAIYGTSLRGKGLFGSHPFAVGVAGGLGSNLAAQLIGEADVALVVGASMNDFTTMRGSLFGEHATIVRCDIDPERAASGDRVVGVVANARDLAVALESELGTQKIQSNGYRPRALERIGDYNLGGEFIPVEERGVLDPRSLVIELDEVLPKERTVITDAGHFFGYPVAYMQVPDGRSFVCGIDFGSIGLGLGLAMGASIAQPERQAVLFIGDGGLLMSIGDLETAVRYSIPLLIVVLNDSAYGSELQILRLWELSEELAIFADSDFAALASAFGARGVTLTSARDMFKLSDQLGWREGPTLIDCKISRTVRSAWLEEAFRH
jgi:acetolactate synthase-1/2/3 large subunit